MSDAGDKKSTEKSGRSRRIYVLWSVALALLLALGLFCRLLVVPVWQTRAAVQRCNQSRKRTVFGWYDQTALEIEKMGGQEAAVRWLSLYLLLPERLAPCRQAAAMMLGECGRKAVPRLIKALKDEDVEVRRVAATNLGVISDGRAFSPLLAAIEDEDEQVRGNAAHALGRVGDPRAAGRLRSALKDGHACVRWAAAGALEKLQDTQAVDPLIAALKDENATVRFTAAGALGKLKARRATQPLVAALSDKDWFTRCNAAWSLGETGDARAIEPLKAALKDRNETVRKSARHALENIRTRLKAPKENQ